MYSSLETICVGTGDGKDDVSAGCSSFNCSSLRNFMSPSHWPRSMAPHQYTQNRNRRRGVDADRPGQNRNFTGQFSNLGLDHSKPVFNVIEPTFKVIEPVFNVIEPIFN